jgi:hypothetical protein
MVQGNLIEPRTKDSTGAPLTVKTPGATFGQPRSDYFFALAIPKTPGKMWWDEEWGAKIRAAGMQAYPQHHLSPKFAWKIEDGDSTVPNQRGRVNARTEGFAGNWVLKFSGGTAPRLFKRDDRGTVYGAGLELDFSNVSPGLVGYVEWHRIDWRERSGVDASSDAVMVGAKIKLNVLK